MTLRDAQIQYPYLNWTDYLNQVFRQIIHVDENETVNFVSLTYFDNLHGLLKITPKRTIANYLIWRATDSFTRHFIIGNDMSRWKDCVRLTNQQLPIATGAHYIRKNFKVDTKNKVAEMAEHIRKEFKEMLQQNTWMDDKTKLAANHKVDSMSLHIGYPDELNDDKQLEAYFEPLVINHTNYLASILNINEFYWSIQLKSLRKPVNRTDWTRHPMPVFNNALNILEFNSIGSICF